MSSSDHLSPQQRLGDLQPDLLMGQGIDKSLSTISVAGIEIKKLIGQGGMGAVYLARQSGLDRDVAVKQVSTELNHDTAFLERLEREARLMAKLSHPNIVTIHHFERLEEGQTAIVMEYIDGGNLRHQIEKHPRGLPLKKATQWIQEIVSALVTAHQSGVVHRDMKPENVLVGNDAVTRVTDFGLALPINQKTATRLTLTGTTVGTLDYLAPEGFQSTEPDARSDIYSVGVILYEMLTGQVPRGSFEEPKKLRPEIPTSLSQATMRALRPNPNERFDSMADFLASIETPARSFTRRHWLALGSGVCGAAIATALWKFSQADENTEKDNKALPPAPPVGEWKDALSQVKLPQSIISGNWKREKFITTDDSICILALKQEMPESYDVRANFIRLSGKHSIAIFFTANGSVGSVDIDGWGQGISGVQNLDGTDLRRLQNFEFWIRNNHPYELRIEVRPEHVKIFINGEKKGIFWIKNRALSVTAPWAWDPKQKPAALAIGSYQSSTVFEKVEWRTAE